LDPPYDIKLVLFRKLHSFLGKSTKAAATRAALFDSNMHQIVCRLELRPRAYSAPRPLIVFRGPTSKGRGEGREEFVLCPRKKKGKSAPMKITQVKCMIYDIERRRRAAIKSR